MAFGLELFNPSGGLVLSSDGFGLNYIGKATYSSDVSMAGVVNQIDGFEDIWGAGDSYATFKQYTIVSAQPVVFFIGLQASHRAGIVRVTRSGSTYTITAFNATGAPDSFGYYTQDLADIYCFARPTAHAGSHGLGIYDSAGNVAYDLSGNSGRPMFIRERIAFSAADTSLPIASSFTTPAIFAGVGDIRNLTVTVTSSNHRIDGQIAGWAISGSNLNRNYIQHRRGPTIFGSTFPSTGIQRVAVNAYLIEAAGL